jgi:tRNA-intron endonuclease
MQDGRVVVPDAGQSSRLLARGDTGTLDPQGRLALSAVEAAWHAAEGRLAVASEAGEPLALADLLAAAGGAGTGRRGEVDYLAYRDLRERGLVARHLADGRFAAWPRGTGSGEPAFHVRAWSDADPLPAGELAAAAHARDVLCVVDADGATTHYQAGVAAPAGEIPQGDLPRAKGAVLADRVLVADQEAATAYHQREFLGTPTPAGLFLSFVEAEGLRRRGVLSVPPGLAGRGAEAARVLPAHLALRSAGAVPKSGFRFGTHLRAYRGAPDDGHAEWLVHCAAPGEPLPWSALSRGVRLAHGVRKTFLVALPALESGPEAVLFTQLTWFRP